MRLTWLRRRAWLIVATVIGCTVSAVLLAHLLPDRYTAEAITIVPPSAAGAGSAGEASNLASTYANLIPEDTLIVERVAAAVGRSPDDVRAALNVTHDFNTSILRLSFTDVDPQVALDGALSVTQAVTGKTPASPRIAKGSLDIVSLPTSAMSEAMSSQQVVVLGVVLGLVLGLVLTVAQERADGRIDVVADLEGECDCPVSSIDQVSDDSVLALLDRWREIVDKPSAQVALLPISAGAERAVQHVADRLVHTGSADERSVGTGSANDRSIGLAVRRASGSHQLAFSVGGAPGGAAAGEALARRADLVVLVITEGTQLSEVRAVMSHLEQFGAAPGWVLFLEHPNAIATSSDAELRSSTRPTRSPRASEPKTKPKPKSKSKSTPEPEPGSLTRRRAPAVYSELARIDPGLPAKAGDE